MAMIITAIVGGIGPWLVVQSGLLLPYDGRVIEGLLRSDEWDARPLVTLDTRRLDGFVYGAERALRYAARIIHARPAGFSVIYDPKGPAYEGLVISGVMTDIEIDFAPGAAASFN